VKPICMPELTGEEASRFLLGAIAGGCMPTEKREDCLKSNNNGYTLSEPGLTVFIGKKGGDGIHINIPLHGSFIHRFMINGKSLSSYITREELDPLIFIGMLMCRYKYRGDPIRAFNDTLDVLSINPRDPIAVLRGKAEAYDTLYRLTEAVERIEDKQDLFIGIAGEKMIVGVKTDDNIVFYSELISVGKGLISSPIRIKSARLATQFSSIEAGKSFVCSKNMITSRGSSKKIEEMNCILGDDPVKLIIWLEKNISASRS
jgi:hypothetical protein